MYFDKDDYNYVPAITGIRKRTRMNPKLSFSELNLSPSLERAAYAMGFSTPTDIQAQTIPLILQGKDVIGRSQTGTGKTVAFGIPAVEMIETDLDSQRAGKVQVLVVCPTRELAMQAADELRKVARYKEGVKIAEVYGGSSMERQILKLKRASIVVGTPGRIMDHLRRRTLRLDQLKMVVLDEADEMLSMGFRDDIETILKQSPENRQTVLFSATMPPAILALTKQYQKNPKMIQINSKKVTLDAISQRYYEVQQDKKLEALEILLETYDPSLAIIFCNTKKMVEQLADALAMAGFYVDGLHGDMDQSQRTRVMNGFKTGRLNLLVATDVAARGIDVNNVDYVFNYDIPQNPEYYVHRIGRTGRAGKEGIAVTLCCGKSQVDDLYQIARMTKSKLNRCKLPVRGWTLEQAEEKYTKEVLSVLNGDKPDLACRSTVEQLVRQGYDPMQLAAAALELHFGKTELVPASQIKEINRTPKVRITKEPYTKIVLNAGKINHVAANHILGALTEHTGFPGSEIGKIDVQDYQTIVSIPESISEQVIQSMQQCRICGRMTSAKKYKEESSKQGNYSKNNRQKPLYPVKPNQRNRRNFQNRNNRHL